MVYRIRAVSIFIIWFLIQTHSTQGDFIEESTDITDRSLDSKDSLATQLISTCLNIITSEDGTQVEQERIAGLCDKAANHLLKDLPLIDNYQQKTDDGHFKMSNIDRSTDSLSRSTKQRSKRMAINLRQSIDSYTLGLLEPSRQTYNYMHIPEKQSKRLAIQLKDAIEKTAGDYFPRSGKRSEIESDIDIASKIENMLNRKEILNRLYESSLPRAGKRKTLIAASDIDHRIDRNIEGFKMDKYTITHNSELDFPRRKRDIDMPRGGKRMVVWPKGGELDLDMPRGGKRMIKMPRGGKRMIDMPRGGKRNIDMPRGGRRVLDMPRGGKRMADMPRGGKRDIDMSRGAKRVIDMPRGGKRIIDMPRGGKRMIDMPRGGKRMIDMPRGGKRVIDMPRGGKRVIDMPRGGKRVIDMPRGGKRVIDRPREETRAIYMPRGGKRMIDMPRGGKRDINFLRGGKRDSYFSGGAKHRTGRIGMNTRHNDWSQGLVEQTDESLPMSNKREDFSVRSEKLAAEDENTQASDEVYLWQHNQRQPRSGRRETSKQSTETMEDLMTKLDNEINFKR